jgi:hypothetical protein
VHLTDPFAEADEDTGETKQSQNYIHIRIQRTSTPLSSPPRLLLRLAGAKGGVHANHLFHNRTQWS